jgi:hypothetical protein
MLRDRHPGIRFVNGYGITETTIFSTFKEIGGDATQGAQNIGQPLANQRVRLLDDSLAPVPDGAVGEIWIEGPAVARGYLNREELSASRFVSDSNGAAGRMYRSGDLARRGHSGDLTFVGRKDDQVKVRGFRVELDEVRNMLLDLGEVQDCVVLDHRDGSGFTKLVAYIQAARDVDFAALRRHAGRMLPEYMLPSRFVIVERFPLAANGKVDRQQLAQLRESAMPASRLAGPTTDTERELLAIFEEILEMRGIGVTDDFFAIGGHSLTAVQLVSRIQESCSAAVSIVDVFTASTVRELAAIIDATRGAGVEVAFTPAPSAAHYALSPIQLQFWLRDHFRRPGRVVDLPAVYELHEPLDQDACAGAVEDLFAAFEILRTTFSLIGDEPRQTIELAGRAAEAFRFSDLAHGPDVPDVVQRIYDRESRVPFDLTRGPLFRMHVLRIAARHHIVLCSLHHIIGDGSSLDVLMRLWRECYAVRAAGATAALEPPTVQFKDYSEWLRAYLESVEGKADVAWWTRTLAGFKPVRLPAGDSRTPSFYARWRELTIDERATTRLKEICRGASATLFMGLQSIVRVFIHLHTGATDITVASPTANRFTQALERQPGPFLNVLVLRTSVQQSETFREILNSVRTASLAAYAKPLIPPELIRGRLGLGNTEPLFEVGFTLQSQAIAGDRGMGSRWIRRPDSFFGLTSPLWFDASEVDGRITISVAYDENCFLDGSIDELVDLFGHVVGKTIERPDVQVRRLAVPQRRHERGAMVIDLDL